MVFQPSTARKIIESFFKNAEMDPAERLELMQELLGVEEHPLLDVRKEGDEVVAVFWNDVLGNKVRRKGFKRTPMTKFIDYVKPYTGTQGALPFARSLKDIEFETETDYDAGLSIWGHPPHYMGFNPVGDYVVYVRPVNSGSTLDESNAAYIRRELIDTKLNETSGLVEGGDEHDDTVAYEWRAGCSITGPIDYFMVGKNAPKELIRKASKIALALKDYPVLDEDDWIGRESERVWDAWEDDYDVFERYKLYLEWDQELPEGIHKGMSREEVEKLNKDTFPLTCRLEGHLRELYAC